MPKNTNSLIKIVVLVLLILFFVQAVRFAPLIFQFLFNRNIDLKQTDSRINVLLLGIGGGVHDGPNLTDTIIFASIDPQGKKATMVSIPRDLWIVDLKAKINTAYATGEEKRKGAGILLAKAVVSQLLNQQINYVVRVDFDGFVQAVDLLGGIDVDVENRLDDYEYPIEGKENDACGHSTEELDSLATASSQLDAFPCRYEHIHFDKGNQHMDGKNALRFVRSRHALGSEGTDFARSRRQEKILSAFKLKILSVNTLLNPVKIIGLYETIKNHIDTNIVQSELDDFVRLAQKMKGATIQNAIMDYGDEQANRYGLLVNPPIDEKYQHQWVLVPRKGDQDYSEIQQYVACLIKYSVCEVGKNSILTPTPVINR